MESQRLPFIPISKLDPDLQARIKETSLISLRAFRAELDALQRIQSRRWDAAS